LGSYDYAGEKNYELRFNVVLQLPYFMPLLLFVYVLRCMAFFLDWNFGYTKNVGAVVENCLSATGFTKMCNLLSC